ncbi:hypothetical protein SLEP1_g29718 [Rubroshorea leprosula]|uniref:Uncharacterized protein n=1 Tax=Rubroshorea leprosula TaxID=152421 RepID=A0AAV5K633_9ROSI|nr:hypothetical protein SLEP1_g29718 [Rubroshorea leprosula]
MKPFYLALLKEAKTWLSHATISPKLTWLQKQYVGSFGSTGKSSSMPVGFAAAAAAATSVAAAAAAVVVAWLLVLERIGRLGLHDLAALTGGQVITTELGMNLEKVEFDVLRSCKQSLYVTVSKDDTVTLDGAGDKKSIEERCEQIRSAIELSTSDYDKEKLQERLAKLSGGVAVLKIVGANEAEVGEKKDRVTDALNATKATVEEGIVPAKSCKLFYPLYPSDLEFESMLKGVLPCSCGVALLFASEELHKLPTDNFDQEIGVQIIQNALKFCITLVFRSNGSDAAKGQCTSCVSFHLGEYVDMVKAGIIDPLKVIRTALVDAASVSSLMTTTEAIVSQLPKDEKETPAMGGMGGMDY